MRTLKQNQRKFYYALYEGRIEKLDSQGKRTGQYTLNYGDPMECFGNIAPPSGSVSEEVFGQVPNYSRVILMDTCPFLEDSILWVDDLDTTKDADYVVKAIAPSLNSVLVAIARG